MPFQIAQHHSMSSENKPVVVRTERVTKDVVERYRPLIHDILARGFYRYESISSGCGVSQDEQAQQQLNALVDDVLLDGVSIVARRTDDNAVVGVVVNKIQEKGQPDQPSYFQRFTSENITNPSAALLVEFMSDADAQVDLFGEMNVDRLLEVMFLCVVPEASGAGVGKALVAASEAIARELGIGAMSALFTGVASQSVGKYAGFRVFDVYPHNKVYLNGVPISDRLRDDQQFSHIVGKALV